MKTKSLRAYARVHNCTLLRACREILTPNSAYGPRCPNGAGVVTLAPVSTESAKAGLKRKAAAYKTRKARQIRAFGNACKGILFA